MESNKLDGELRVKRCWRRWLWETFLGFWEDLMEELLLSFPGNTRLSEPQIFINNLIKYFSSEREQKDYAQKPNVCPKICSQD